MNKKITSIIMAVLVAVSTLVISMPTSAAGSTSFTITADKTTVNPGDTIIYTVKLGAVQKLAGTKFKLSIPEGLTYVANSGQEAEGIQARLNAAKAEFTESTRVFAIGSANYTSTTETVLMTFQCTVDAGTTGEKSVGFIIDDPDNIIDTNSDNISFVTNPAKVNIVINATDVTLDKNTLSLKTDESETLIATVTPDNATNKKVTWRSDNEAVATVDNNGKVTAVKKGTATITTTTEDGGFKDTCTVTVACAHTNTTNVSEDPSTCVYQGHAAYTKCNDCNEIISGSDAKLPLENHQYGNHVEAEHLKSAATCVAKAVYYKSCDVCGLQDADTFEYGTKDEYNHVGGTYVKDNKPTSCYEEGYTGDTYCEDCDVKLSEGTTIPMSAHTPKATWTTTEDEHWKECGANGCGAIIAGTKEAHKGGEATCIAKAKCSVCGVSYGVVNTDNHKNTELRGAEPATEEKEGYTGDTWCLDCNRKIATGTVIEKLEHKIEKVEAKNATCTEEGNTEYYACKNCGKVYEDKDGKNEIDIADTVLKKIAHDTELQNVQAATADKKGYTGDKVCKVCKQVIEQGKDTPATGKESPKTGDGNNAIHWVSFMFMAVAAAVIVYGYKKEKVR